MGLLRLLLALGVVTEHAGHTYFIGSYTAVQIFFVISGFYMELIFSSGKYRNANQFYASRIARLFPVYWIALITGVVVAYAIYACFGTNSAITLLEGRLSELQSTNTPVYIWAIFSNVFLLLADFAWFMPNIDGIQHPTHLLVQPPVWTLALELYFYALCPMLTRARTFGVLALIGLSVSARVLCYQFGWDVNPYHARFFPFELTFFLSGMLAYRLYANEQFWITRVLRGRYGIGMGLVYLACVVYFYDIVKYLPAPSLYGGFQDYVHSMVMCALAIPTIVALFSHTRTNKIDQQLGALSYPIYVIHYGFVSTLLHTQIKLPLNISTYSATIALTVTLAICMHACIQIRVDLWRQRRFMSNY